MGEVAIRNVSKRFGALDVIRGVDVDIPDGEFVVLVGPSGCGKSTLLRMVAGLETISGGTVSIGGRVVNGVPPKGRDIAMVFQNYALYPHMSVAENMSFSLRLRRAPAEEMTRRVGNSAGILGLNDLLERYPKQLSGGQRQRVAMGRATVRDPKVFLFDEPLSNLDAKLRVHMRSEIKALHQRLGTTTIYVTHDQIEAMTLADRIVVMRDGQVEQVGTPLQLYDDPANMFVAGFIGSPSMNFLQGRLTDGGTRLALDGGGDLPVQPSQASGAVVGADSKVICGVRPEHFLVAEGTSEREASDAIEMTISVVEPTGSETLVVGQVMEQPVTAVFRERHGFKPGKVIRLRTMPGCTLLFDPATQARLA